MADSEDTKEPQEPIAYIADLSDFKPDPDNLNLHTQRGQAMVTQSQQKRGYARPAFAAKDGTVLGGNLSTMEVAADIGLGEGKVFVVESSGDIPIIHLRTDIESGSDEAVLLAAEDNKSSLISINFSPDQLLADVDRGIDFTGIFYPEEIERLAGVEVKDPLAEWGGMPEFEQEDKTSFQAIHIHFKNAEEVDEFAKLIGQSLTGKTRSIWYSEREQMDDGQERYIT